MKNVWSKVVNGGIVAWICFGLLVQSVLNLVTLGITLVYDSLVMKVLYTSSTVVQAIFVGATMYPYLVPILRKSEA